MAAPAPVITCAFQQTENNTSIWKWDITSTQIPLDQVSSMVTANLGGGGRMEGQGNVILMKNINDE